MQPYTASENDWVSLVALTPAGTIDVIALEAAARRERARLIGRFFAHLLSSGRRRSQAKAVQRDLDRAALA
jgi:hypothetical protein